MAAYEVVGREVVLYWRGMGATDSIDIKIDAVGVIPGHYAGQASSAYLYYTDELKAWAPGITVDIAGL